MIFSVVLTTVHAKCDLAVFAVVVIALSGLLNDSITGCAHLVVDSWVQSHRAEHLLELYVDPFDCLLTSLLRMGLKRALETLSERALLAFVLIGSL